MTNLTRNLTRGQKAGVAAIGMLLAAPALTGCGGEAEAADIAIVDLKPDEVRSATFIADGQQSPMELVDGIWTPRDGNTEGAILLDGTEDSVFPMIAYRILPEGTADQNNPRYGLTRAAGSAPLPKECGTGCGLEVTGKDGETRKLTIGSGTFNDAGFYAKVEGDPKTYLLTRQTVGDIISIATGTQFEFPPTEKIQEVDEKLAAVGQETGAPDHHPFLTQVLAAQQAERDAAAGKQSSALSDAATSTEDLAGAGDENAGGSAGDTPGAGGGDAGSNGDSAERPIERGSQAGDVQ